MPIQLNLPSIYHTWDRSFRSPRPYSPIKRITWIALAALALSIAMAIGWKIYHKKFCKPEKKADPIINVFKENHPAPEITNTPPLKSPISELDDYILTSIFSRTGMSNSSLALVSKRWHAIYQQESKQAFQQALLEESKTPLGVLIQEAKRIVPLQNDMNAELCLDLQYNYVFRVILEQAQRWEGHQDLFERVLGKGEIEKLNTLTYISLQSVPYGFYKLQLLAKWIRDQHLILFFNESTKQNHEFNEAAKLFLVGIKNLGVTEQARHMRIWLNEHSPVCLVIERLNLSNQKISEIPLEIGHFSHLKELILSDNDLRHLPNSLANLTNLIHLNLTYNKFYTLPDAIGNLSYLQELFMETNDLESLPDSIRNLTQLIKLNLNNNNIKKLPDSFEPLIKLESLSLNLNRLKNLPDSIKSLQQLKQLHLYSNRLAALPDLSFLRNLKILDIRDNAYLIWTNNLSKVTLL